MIPAARIAAAIDILDAIFDGQPAEQALTRWGRGNRYAGSKDRAAIRDHVFDALRCKRSYGWLGGAETGRGVMLGACRAKGADIDALFDGSRFAPPPVEPHEAGAPLEDAPEAVQLDCPDWLLERFRNDLEDHVAVLTRLRERAGVFLRVNRRNGTVANAQAVLAQDGIETEALSAPENALEVVENQRKVARSSALMTGLVEIQDPASQRAMQELPLRDGLNVLDLCAGGGGKALAMADRFAMRIDAHDIAPERMADLPIRAERAGVEINRIATADLSGPYDLVLIDAPCSGSGTWRRTPAAKWDLTEERLAELCDIQAGLLQQAKDLAGPSGVIAYATCSVLSAENQGAVDGFLAGNSDWAQVHAMSLLPERQQDGFFLSILRGPKAT